VSFFEKVRAGYLDLARGDPARMHLIDATAALSEVQQQVARILARLRRA
jgi:thymidylate kinase